MSTANLCCIHIWMLHGGSRQHDLVSFYSTNTWNHLPLFIMQHCWSVVLFEKHHLVHVTMFPEVGKADVPQVCLTNSLRSVFNLFLFLVWHLILLFWWFPGQIHDTNIHYEFQVANNLWRHVVHDWYFGFCGDVSKSLLSTETKTKDELCNIFSVAIFLNKIHYNSTIDMVFLYALSVCKRNSTRSNAAEVMSTSSAYLC